MSKRKSSPTTEPKDRPKKPRTPVGAAVAAWGEAVELVDAIYQAQHGEVDEGSEAAEHFAELAADDALEHLARFLLFCEDGKASIKREAERLAVRKKSVERRIAWAEDKVREILAEQQRTSKAVGAYHVKTRAGSKSVRELDGFNIDDVPRHLVRYKPTPPPELDKKAALAYLENDGEMPIPNLEVHVGKRSVKVH